MTTTKQKVIGEKYGIAITKPWNNEMYAHNDSVAKEMKERIARAVKNRGRSREELNEIATHVTAYKFGDSYSVNDIRNELLESIATLENYWLAQEYRYLVQSGYVEPTDKDMIGYEE